MSQRYSYARRILGDDLFAKVEGCRVLMVGAGGIGCELLKNVVTAGFGYVEIIDLDTIDLSNLNRQFLFQKQHVKRSKALVAQETAHKFNPHTKVHAIHGNIKEARFDVAYFKSFDIVMNALDNMDARRHVNKMCMAADVPLVESGTAGYSGQVQPIKKDLVECYDCSGKPVTKGFPVCTIRSTPSTPIHCIVWAKSYLFPQLFGVSDDGEELDNAAADGENKTELNELRKEAEAIKQIRSTLGQEGSTKRVFDKIFNDDIKRLLTMEDMWKHRTKPIPCKYDQMQIDASQKASTSSSNGASSTAQAVNGSVNTIKDQRELSLTDSFLLFVESLNKLTARVTIDPDTPLEWDKDDDDALDFATAAANIRAYSFGIPSKTRFDVKQMAGNIIPAIATTNAIVAGLVVLQALNVLKKTWKDARLVWVSRTLDRAVTHTVPVQPNAQCSVCRTPYISIEVDPTKLTLARFVKEVVQERVKYSGDVSLVEGSRLLFDPDFEDNAEKTFGNLGLEPGTMLTVNDEDGDLTSAVFLISALSADSADAFKLVGDLPEIPEKVPPPAEPVSDAENNDSPIKIAGRKRSADEAELENGNTQKKAKVDSAGVIVLDDDDDILISETQKKAQNQSAIEID